MAQVTQHTETICDDNGIELIVAADVEQSSSQIQECHGYHDVGCLIDVTLKSVEIVIAGKGVEILDRLTESQKNIIESKLNIE